MRLETDFNEVYDGDYVWLSLRHVADPRSGALAPGDWVELFDEDGDACLAQVTDRQGVILTCKIDWSTWRSVSTHLTTTTTTGAGGWSPIVTGKLVAAS